MKAQIRIIYNSRWRCYQFRKEIEENSKIIPLSGWYNGRLRLEDTKNMAEKVFGEAVFIVEG